jgi:two-component system KDP operon response regulator KdpE
VTVPARVIVLIEDEVPIRRFLRTALGAEGFDVHEADDGRRGLAAAANRKPDLIILDLGLPDMDGVEVVRELRSWSAVPIIVLSARTMERDKIAALDAGADDYLAKPFGVGELLARIRVALRHSAVGPERHGPVIEVGALRIDLARRQVSAREADVHLTPLEFRLLAALARNAGKVMTHRQLLKEVWGPPYVEHTHYLRIYMAQLRHKLEEDPARPRWLLTEAGVGYRLAED